MIYTVRCKACSPRKEFEVEMSPLDDPPVCKCGNRTTKVMLPVAVAYSGSGWTGARKDG